MLENDVFKKFIALVSFDNDIKKIAKERELLNVSIKNHQDQKNKLILSDSEFCETVTTAQKNVDSCELEMRSFEKEEQDLKLHIDQVRYTNEYQALKREIELLKKKQHDYENVLVAAWGKLEALQKELIYKKQEIEKNVAALEEVICQEEQKKGELDAKIERGIQERKVLEKEVPEIWMQQYLNKRAISDDPIVPVVSGCCSVCFYNLSSQDYMHMKKSRLTQCRECYRLLYEQQEA